MSPFGSPKRAVAGAVGAALAAGSLAALTITPAANAAPDGSGVVISEVYGAGGFSASSTFMESYFQYDFVELYNPTAAPVSLDGMSLQYLAATTGTATIPSGGNLFLFEPDDVIPAGGHFLVSGSGSVDNGYALPEVDSVGSFNLSSTLPPAW